MDQSSHSAGVTFLSPWGPYLPQPEVGSQEFGADLERHEFFRAYVFALLQTHVPWLLRLIEASGAQILASPGAFYFAFDAAPDDWTAVPELSHMLTLTPWVDESETSH